MGNAIFFGGGGIVFPKWGHYQKSRSTPKAGFDGMLRQFSMKKTLGKRQRTGGQIVELEME